MFTDTATYFKQKDEQTKFFVDTWFGDMLAAGVGLTELPATTSQALVALLLPLSGYGALAQAVAASDLSVHIRGVWQMLHATSRINSTTSYLDTTTGFANLVLGRGGAHAHFAAIIKKGAAHATHKVSFLGSPDVENLSMAIVLSNVGVEVVEAAIATDARSTPVHVVADASLFDAILRVAAKANLLQDLPRRIQGVLMAVGDVVLPDVGLYSAGNSRSHFVAYTPFRIGCKMLTTLEIETDLAARSA
ncbi:hypothetical protein SPRG_15787 [Saprolegnia parasitica CBS 223.65]|uniref:Uncharacterized protein n=1 Tax=Saprolegnia parasitica (strain CBS 223.65) TaxID=695850 RepID=A0A067BPZ0_SAPPC|nr:hypothetical protein SPRG_15787 [Saprolegnia parasitica CBS 223.65]KDO18840.1 hypothetical protein SPRG_15787 [Saprolegnia parasitica CBS 223.65]|eukprot:XP_012210453.1 hypothetical protein SPRG_15787 [Saprolegnia parasitica CBS 223.65]